MRPGDSGAVGSGVGGLARLGLATCVAVPGVCLRRAGDIVREFEWVAVHGSGVVLAAGVCVGAAAWLQTHRLLAQHGAESTLPSFLAVAVLVEIGPLLAGLILAGRAGAGLAAEMAAMVQNEEIDARLALGTNVAAGLVAPRAIACMFAVPFLTIVLDAAALGGGFLAESSSGRASAALYWSKSLVFLEPGDVIPATLKTAVFGWLVATSACWTGLNAGRSTQDVGRAAIRGVVLSVVVVFVSNLIMIPFIQALPGVLGGRHFLPG